MTGPDFDHFRRLVLDRSGLVLTADKGYLVQSRLEPVARSFNLAGVPEVLAALARGGNTALAGACVDAMATHESLFFRDGAPFEHLARLLPELVDGKPAGVPLRVWSAACSSGQEPYSIAMALQENAVALAGRRVEIVATDMSEAILSRAHAGLYSDFEVQRGLSPERRDRWMTARGGNWEVSPLLKGQVSFRRHNLLEPPLGLSGFDIVFCRNVLIYFDVDGKRRALAHVAQATAASGALFLGSAETVMGLSDAFDMQPGARGVYRRKAAATPVRMAG